MNLWLAYGLGVATLPVGIWLWGTIHDLRLYIRREWITTITWLPTREWKRWEWGEAGRCLSFTPRHWPRKALVVTLRPWRPITR